MQQQVKLYEINLLGQDSLRIALIPPCPRIPGYASVTEKLALEAEEEAWHATFDGAESFRLKEWDDDTSESVFQRAQQAHIGESSGLPGIAITSRHNSGLVIPWHRVDRYTWRLVDVDELEPIREDQQ